MSPEIDPNGKTPDTLLIIYFLQEELLSSLRQLAELELQLARCHQKIATHRQGLLQAIAAHQVIDPEFLPSSDPKLAALLSSTGSDSSDSPPLSPH